MSRFDGRVAIVTGAASGIGKEIALRFAAEGGIPVIADLNIDAANATAGEIKANGSDAFAVAMNVTDEAEVEKGIADVIAKYGKVDVLVSNAGIQIVKPLVDFPFADWKKLLSIHLDGAFLTTKACLKHMYAANYGRVVYMGSVHSKEASKLKAPYVTAKHGLVGLARVLAKEGAEHNVTANVVCPGFVRTALVDKQIPEQAMELGITEDQVIKTVLLKDTVDGEFTTTDDVADAVLAAITPHSPMPSCQPSWRSCRRSKTSPASNRCNLTILTAARTSEVALAEWSEFDLVSALWTVPGIRTKTGKEHRVPLSREALALLAALPRSEGQPHVFPDCGTGTMLKALKRIDATLTTHGMRSAFRDWAGNETSFQREVIEECLQLPGEVERAYRRGEALDKRCKVLAAWASYLAAGGKVVTLRSP